MKALVTVDMGYGDSGKGSMVDYLVRLDSSKLVVRYGGGPQASHHVVLPDGTSHGFAQMGAGTFAGAHTYLSKYMMIEPWALMNELNDLSKKTGVSQQELLSMLHIDRECIIITPWHWKMNQLREINRGDQRHGSCGMGVGEAREDANSGLTLRLKHLLTCNDTLNMIRDRKIIRASEFGTDSVRSMLRDDSVQRVASFYCDFFAMLSNAGSICGQMPPAESVVFEGSQGILIDETLGFQPYTTWCDVTPRHARTIIAENRFDDVETIGIVPAVMSRHGPGPFLSEDSLMTKIGGPTHNKDNRWQGSVRWGWLDMVAIRHALHNVPVDCVALTQVDRVIRERMLVVDRYITPSGCEIANINSRFLSHPAVSTDLLMTWSGGVEHTRVDDLDFGVPVKYESHGPTHHDKLCR